MQLLNVHAYKRAFILLYDQSTFGDENDNIVFFEIQIECIDLRLGFNFNKYLFRLFCEIILQVTYYV